MANQLTSASKMLKYCVEWLGLEDFHFHFVDKSDGRLTIKTDYEASIPIPAGVESCHSLVTNLFSGIEKKIHEAPSHKERERRIEFLESRISDLEKYKTHYEIEMNLRHGEKNG